jgi:hypothetical protein
MVVEFRYVQQIMFSCTNRNEVFLMRVMFKIQLLFYYFYISYQNFSSPFVGLLFMTAPLLGVQQHHCTTTYAALATTAIFTNSTNSNSPKWFVCFWHDNPPVGQSILIH